MFQHTDWTRAASIAQNYRKEADTARLLAQAPRSGANHPTLARALRALANGLARTADHLEPSPTRTIGREQAAWIEGCRVAASGSPR